MRFYPYLSGYVAFYLGDYKTAIAELQKADQKDPFVLSLLAQAYEKSGDKAQALDYYRKVLTINSHSPTNAFARPLAKRKSRSTGEMSELERGTGIEPVTSSLGSSRSTAELTPLTPVGEQSVPSAQISSQCVAIGS